MHLYNFFVCGPKFTRFLLSNQGWVAVDQLRVRFLKCRPVPGIFAIKVENCQKSRRNLDVFWPSQIYGAGLPKIVRTLSPLSRDTSARKVYENIPTSPEVIGVHTLNFKPNFKFSRLEFFWGDPRPTLGVRYQGLVNL